MISDTNRRWMAAFIGAMHLRLDQFIAFGVAFSLCACSPVMADDTEDPQPSDVTLLATPFVRTFYEPTPYVLRFTEDGQRLLAGASDGSIFVLSVPALELDRRIQVEDEGDIISIAAVPQRQQCLVVSHLSRLDATGLVHSESVWLIDDSGETEPRKLFEAYSIGDCAWIDESDSVGVVGAKKTGEAESVRFWRIDIETGEVLEEAAVDAATGASLRCSSSSGLLLTALSFTNGNNATLYWRDADADTFAPFWRLDASDSALWDAECGVEGNRVFALRWCGTQAERGAFDGRSAQAEIRCIEAPSGDVLYSVRDERPVGKRVSARDLALIGRRPLLATVGTTMHEVFGGWGGWVADTGELQIRSTRDGRLISQQRTNYGLSQIVADPFGNWIATLGRLGYAGFVTMWEIVPEVKPPDAAGQ